MAPTELMSEAPTDGEEWFLGRNARKDRQREDSESESLPLRSLPVLQPMTSLCFLSYREKSLGDQARRHYALAYILKTSLGPLQWGKDHCEKNGGDGVEVLERLEMRFDFMAL